MHRDILVITGTALQEKVVLAERFLREVPEATRLVTHTTRIPQKKRDGTYEIHEKDYIFLDKVSFTYEYEKLKTIFEFTERSGVYYGSSRVMLESLLLSHPSVVVLVDPKGALSYQARYGYRVLTVALSVPENEIRQRSSPTALMRGSFEDKVQRTLKDKHILDEHRRRFDLWVDITPGWEEGAAQRVLGSLRFR